MRKVVLGVIVIVSVGAGLHWFAQNTKVGRSFGDLIATSKRNLDRGPGVGTDGKKNKRYLTAVARRGVLRETVSATGRVKAVLTVEVGSQISGQIESLFVDFNEEVKEGQLLAQLDQKTFVAQLAEAQAALRMAKAQVRIRQRDVERAQIGIRDAKVQIPIFQARLAKAQADAIAAEADFQRSLKLHNKGLASAKAHDGAKARRAVAAALIREAEAIIAAQKEKINAAKVGLARAGSELADATANVAQKQALLAIAKINLQRATIRSPIDGVVIKRNVERGQTVAASLEAPTLFTIAQDLRQMQVDARIDETDIGKMKLGQRAFFTVDAFPGQKFEGKVTQIRKAPTLRQSVVTYTVVILTQNPGLVLIPGMTAAIEIVVMETGELLKIPNAALTFSPSSRPKAINRFRLAGKTTQRSPQALVWKLDNNGEPSPTPLRLGHRDTSNVEVRAGALKEGDRVIVSEISRPRNRRLFGIRIGF